MIKHKQTRKHVTKLCYLMVLVTFGMQFSHASTLSDVLVSSFAFDNVNQDITITGTVTSSEDGLPLPGVSIIVEGTTTGTQTDFDGNYSISVPSEDSVLSFSYLGYSDQKIAVGSNTTLNVSMAEDLTDLDEVVVVGYGTQKKEVITGSIDVVKSDVFESRAISNPVLALQGATPGLIVSRSSSRPGEEGTDIVIRGATSINGSAALVVVDGVPNADFSLINPDDIESISVLKDASAAIYGARAAGGVVLVTTKKGKGKINVNINSQVRVNSLGIKPQSTSAKEYFDVYVDAMESDEAVMGLASYNAFGWLSLDNARSIRDFLAAGNQGYVNSFWGVPANNPTDIYLVNNNIWDAVYGPSISNQQNISISGSTEKIDYRLSGMYEENVGAVDVTYDGEIQYNVRSVINFQVTDRFKIGTNISLNHNKLSQPSAGLTGSVFTNDPAIYPTVNPYGQWVANFNHSGGARQPIADLVDGGRNFEERDRFNFAFDATYNITDHLDLVTTASFIVNNVTFDTYDLEVPIYSYDGTALVNTLKLNNSSYRKQLNTGRQDTFGTYLKYKNTFKDAHNFAVTAGINTENLRNSVVWGERTGFEDQGVLDLNLASTEILVENGSTNNHEGLYGIIGNATYDYKEKYLANFIFRRDGSSRFSPDNRWNNFLSASIGWVVTNEDFMENVGFLDFLKFRASYGETANAFPGNGILGRYDYVSTIGLGTTLFGETPTFQATAFEDEITSNKRTWERVEQKNIGVDFKLFKNRLSGSFDYFEKRNPNMFIPVIYPEVIGGDVPTTNNGVLDVKGWEASLDWRSSVGEDFTYSIGAFVSDTRDNIADLSGFSQPGSGVTNAVEGFPIQSLWVYETDGIFQNQAEVDEYYATYGIPLNDAGNPMTDGNTTTQLSPGDIRKVDVNGDGTIDQTDLVYVGDAKTHFNFGINLSANYKGWDAGALFQGVGEQNLVRTGVFAYPIVGRFTNQTDQFLGQTWTPENTDAIYPRTTTHTTRSNWNWSNNDFRVQNNKYIRLKTLTLGYTLPKIKISEMMELNKVRLYFTGNDLWEAANINDGYDPEYGLDTEKTYPYTRTWAFGVNVNF